MNVREQDLEGALRPLAGDPADDYARVMAALPAASLPGPRWPWWVAATAAGLIAGWIIGQYTGAGPAARPTPPTRFEAAADAPRIAFATGDVVVETAAGPAPLVTGSYFPIDHFLATVDEAQALIALPGSTELRLAAKSRLWIATPRSANLLRGTLFVHVPEVAGRFYLETLEGTVECDRGSFQVRVSESRVEVLAVHGETRFTSLADERLELRDGESCAVEDGALSPKVRPPILWSEVSWQRLLLLRAAREDELIGYLHPLVYQLVEPGLAGNAERHLRSAGWLGAFAIGYLLEAEITEQRGALWRRCVAVLADIADAMSCRLLLPVLLAEDADARIQAVQALERVTGMKSGRDEWFWRNAPRSARFDLFKRWREKLDGF